MGNKVYIVLDQDEETGQISIHSVKADLEEAKRIADRRQAVVAELPIVHGSL